MLILLMIPALVFSQDRPGIRRGNLTIYLGYIGSDSENISGVLTFIASDNDQGTIGITTADALDFVGFTGGVLVDGGALATSATIGTAIADSLDDYISATRDTSYINVVYQDFTVVRNITAGGTLEITSTSLLKDALTLGDDTLNKDGTINFVASDNDQGTVGITTADALDFVGFTGGVLVDGGALATSATIGTAIADSLDDYMSANRSATYMDTLFFDQINKDIFWFRDGADRMKLDSTSGKAEIHIDYITGAIAAGTEHSVIHINIEDDGATGGLVHGIDISDVGTGTVTVVGMGVFPGVKPLVQHTGSFATPDKALKFYTAGTPSDTTDVTTAFGSTSADSSLFNSENDAILFGAAAVFDEVEVILNTAASGGGIAPTFWYSSGSGTWTEFFPEDGSNGMRDSGIIFWVSGDLSWTTWDYNGTDQYWIRIIRTRANLTTAPIEDTFKILASTDYIWDENGDINLRNVTVAGDLLVGTAASGKIITEDINGETRLTFIASDNDTTGIVPSTADALGFTGATGGYTFDAGITATTGNITGGTNDTNASNIILYGDNASVDPTIDMYNSANNDTNEEYWRLQPNGDNFYIGTENLPTAFSLQREANTYTLNIGAADAKSGRFILWGGAGAVNSVMLMANGDNDDATEDYWTLQPAGINYYIGPVSDADALILTNGGNLTIAGSVATKATGTAWVNPSDKRIKQNIEDITNGLEILRQLNPKTYNYTTKWILNNPSLEKAKTYRGFIADDVELVIPKAVTSIDKVYRTTKREVVDAEGKVLEPEEKVLEYENIKVLDTSDINVLAISAIKELDVIVKALQYKIETLEARIEKLEE